MDQWGRALGNQEALLASMKQALEALDAFLVGTLTPQQSAEAQAAFAQPLRQLVKEHELIVASLNKPVEAKCIECEASIALKEEAAAAEAWLREKGFEPKGDLCQASSGDATAMYKACEGGELGVCKGGQGAASTTRAKVNDGWTPMHSVWPTVTARGLAAAIIAVETLVSDLARIPSLS